MNASRAGWIVSASFLTGALCGCDLAHRRQIFYPNGADRIISVQTSQRKHVRAPFVEARVHDRDQGIAPTSDGD